MPLATSISPIRLAIFVVETGVGLPIARLPIFSEIIVRSETADVVVPVDHQLDDDILQALKRDAAENLHTPQPRQRLADIISQEIARQFGPSASDVLAPVGAIDFIATSIARARASLGGATLRSIDSDKLVPALRDAIRQEAAKQRLPLQPPAPPTPTLWAYPLGVLATDHNGYLSYDLSKLPANVLAAVAATIQARHLDPTAALEVTIAVYPTGLGGKYIDAIAQGRVTSESVVARIELTKPQLPDAVRNLGLPAMQSPSLEDWRLSPGSFATNPGSLVGADGCESILPANVALQEFYFYQVVRLMDVVPPVASVNAGQVQLGIVNEYRVSWNPLGHSLGQIIYSMPLAPGESVNLAVIDWTRRDEAQRKERNPREHDALAFLDIAPAARVFTARTSFRYDPDISVPG